MVLSRLIIITVFSSQEFLENHEHCLSPDISTQNYLNLSYDLHQFLFYLHEIIYDFILITSTSPGSGYIAGVMFGIKMENKNLNWENLVLFQLNPI